MRNVLILPLLAAMAFPGLITGAGADELPTPPVPPDTATVAENAPVPDLDAGVPSAHQAEQPNVNVKFYRSNTFDPGAGFVPGSRYQSSEDRKPIQTPGLSVTVPIR